MTKAKITMRNIKQICGRAGDKLTYIFCALALAAALFFLYGYFFQALIDVRVLQTLKNDVAPEVVNIKLWQELNKDIAFKKEPLKTDLININPFQ